MILLAICAAVVFAEQQIDPEVYCQEQAGECDAMKQKTGMDKLDSLTQAQAGSSESGASNVDLAVIPDLEI